MTAEPPQQGPPDGRTPDWFAGADPEPAEPSRFSSGAVVLGVVALVAAGVALSILRPSRTVLLVLGLATLIGGLAVAAFGRTARRRGLGLGLVVGWGLAVGVSGLFTVASGAATGFLGYCSQASPFRGGSPTPSTSPSPPAAPTPSLPAATPGSTG